MYCSMFVFLTGVLCLYPLYLQYDLFVINLVLRLLRNEYPEFGDANNVSGMNIHELEGSVAAAALVGSIIGQLVAGRVCVNSSVLYIDNIIHLEDILINISYQMYNVFNRSSFFKISYFFFSLIIITW